MSDEIHIREAEFDPKVCTYWLLSGALTLTVIVVGIPLLPFWLLFGTVVTKRFLATYECLLTDKAIRVKKGILIRVEKTIPLEKITDMGMVQGPIMRQFGLYRLTVETAGQSGPGGELSLTGVIDAKSFRESVLKQRAKLSEATSPSASRAEPQAQVDPAQLLGEIRDSLLRIEATVKKVDNRQ